MKVFFFSGVGRLCQFWSKTLPMFQCAGNIRPSQNFASYQLSLDCLHLVFLLIF